MRSDLRSLRERIRQVEAGGHRDTPLRRAYNRKLRALKILGGGKNMEKVKADIDILYSDYRKCTERLNECTQRLDNLSTRIDTLATMIEPDEK